ncbi:MAG: hypothetical protein ACK5PS_10950 [Desulfopila sp.]
MRNIAKRVRARSRSIGLLLLLWALLVSGCTGITPANEPLRDHREEGPTSGLFSGSAGEFVLLRPADKPADTAETGKEAGKVRQGQSSDR